jgi:FkbM family methyltransferase
MARHEIKSAAKSALRRFGLEMRRVDPDGSFAKRRQRLLEQRRIATVLDVGAHDGEFGASLRHGGFDGSIASFEPIEHHFHLLAARASADSHWHAVHCAIGTQAGSATINISGNEGFSSSLREMTDRHVQGEPSSAYVRTETVDLQRLDEAIPSELDTGGFFLKIDTQGFEAEVLDGGPEALARAQMVELELGFVELYAGQALFADLVGRMREEGFVLSDLEPAFRDTASGELLQVDALFVRSPDSDRNN